MRSSRAVTVVRRSYWLEWASITLYAVFIIGVFINSRSVWLDEATSVFISSQPLRAMAGILQHVDAVHALYYSVLHIWLGLGHSAIVIRLLSAIFALLALPVLAALARALFGEETAPASVAVMVTSAIFVVYADEARSIAFTLLATVCAALMFIRAANDGHRLDVALFGLSSIVAIYTNVLSLFFIAALVLSLSVMQPSRSKLRSIAIAVVAIAVATLPLLLLIHANSTIQIDWIKRSTPIQTVHFLFNILGGEAGSGRIGFATSVFEAAVVAGLIVIGVMANWRDAKRSNVVLAIIWLLVPLIAAIVVDHFIHPILIVRYFAFELIPAGLLAGAGLVAIKESGRAAVAYGIVTAFAVITAYNVKTIQREDWRSVAALITREAQPGDAIVIWKGGTVIPFEFAVSEQPRKIAATIVYPTGRTGMVYADPPANLVPQLSRQYKTVWFVLSHDKTHGDQSSPFDSLSRFYPHPAEAAFAGIKVETYRR